MACRSVLPRVLVLLGVALSTITAAKAASTPTWVSATGTDEGTCAIATPCATFQYAISKTLAGGTIFVANSGSYGRINLTKALSIIAPDGVQAIVTLGQHNAYDGILVNPGSGNIVLLKGLTVADNNADAGYFADIEVDSGRVTIENCTMTTGNWGVYATNPDFLLLRKNHIEGTARGVENHANVSTIYLDGNAIVLNDYAVVGSVNSYGNNTMNGNALCDVCAATITATSFDQ